MCLADHTVEGRPCHPSHSDISAAVEAGTEVADIHPLSHMAEAEVVAVDNHPCFHIEAVAAAETADNRPYFRTVADNLQMDSFAIEMSIGPTAHHNFHTAYMHWHMGSLERDM